MAKRKRYSKVHHKESEMPFLNSPIQKKHSQLTSFNTILGETEIPSVYKFSANVEDMDSMCQSKDKECPSQTSQEILELQVKVKDMEEAMTQAQLQGKTLEKELYEKNVRAQELEKQVQMLQEQMQVLLANTERDQIELEDLRANSTKQSQVIEILKSNKDQQVCQSFGLQLELGATKSQDKKLSQSSKQIKKLQSKERLDRKKITSVATDRNEALKRKEQLEMELASIHLEANNRSKEREEAVTKNKELEMELASKMTVINHMISEKEELEAALTSSKKMVGSVVKGKNKVEKMNGKAKLQVDLAENMKKIQELETELTDILKKSRSISEERDAALSKTDELETEFASNMKIISRISSEKEDLESAHTASRKMISNLRKEKNIAERKMEKMQIEFAEIMKDVDFITSEKQEAVRKGETLETELANLRKENNQLKHQFNSVVTFVGTKMVKQILMIDSLAKEVNALEQIISSLKEQQMSNSASLVEIQEQEMVKQVSMIDSLAKEINALEQMISSLKGQHTSNNASLVEIQEQDAKLESLTQQLSEAVNQKQLAEEKVRDMTKQLTSSEQEMVELHSEYDNLKKESDGICNLYKLKLASLESEKLCSEAVIKEKSSQLSSIKSLMKKNGIAFHKLQEEAEMKHELYSSQLKRENIKLEQNLEGTLKDKQRLKKENKILRKRNFELKKYERELKTLVQQLQKPPESMNNLHMKSIDPITSLSREENKLTQEVYEGRNKNQELEFEVASMEGVNGLAKVEASESSSKIVNDKLSRWEDSGVAESYQSLTEESEPTDLQVGVQIAKEDMLNISEDMPKDSLMEHSLQRSCASRFCTTSIMFLLVILLILALFIFVIIPSVLIGGHDICYKDSPLRFINSIFDPYLQGTYDNNTL